MPITRAHERNSLSLPNSPQKTYTLTSHLPTQYEENYSMTEKTLTKKHSDLTKKINGTTSKHPPSTPPVPQSFQSSRRPTNHDGLPPMRGRSNTDVQYVSSLSNNLKQQQLNLNGSGSDKTVNHHAQQRTQSPITVHSKITLSVF